MGATMLYIKGYTTYPVKYACIYVLYYENNTFVMDELSLMADQKMYSRVEVSP